MDRISNSTNPGSFPINQALRAYAQSPRVNKPGGAPFVKSVPPLRPVAPLQETQSTQRSARPDTIAKISPKQSVLASSSISQLVGAKVEPIDLGSDVTKIRGARPITTSAGTYTMYPRANDLNQAATNIAANVSLGRSLDLNG